MTQAIVPVAPSYLPSLFQPEQLKAMADEFGGGLSSSAAFPRVTTSGTRFRVKDGELDFIVKDSFVDVIIVKARANLDKTYYETAFDPSADAKEPDCYSKDGMKPAADAAHPQCETCKGCPFDAFGSGRDAAGRPTGGKACRDTKQLAILPYGGANKLYGFKIPPTSLKAYGAYVKLLSGYNLNPALVKTRIEFDSDITDKNVLKFTYQATLDPDQISVVQNLRATQEAEDICGGSTAAPAPPRPAIAPPVQAAPVVVPEPEPAFGAFAPAAPEKPAPAPRKRAAAAPAPAAELEVVDTPFSVSGPTEDAILKKLGF